MAEERKHDRKGIPIYAGDLLRTFHFRDRTCRGKIRYLYHYVLDVGGHLEMVPPDHLDPSRVKDGGRCWLASIDTETQSEIVHGYGPDPGMCFDERPRRRPAKNNPPG